MIYVHNINPVIFNILGFEIRYYSLAYIFGLIFIPWCVNKYYLKNDKISNKFETYIALGVILGGRAGYVLFYDFLHFFRNPIDIVKIWEGGMSFHGGLIGFIFAVWIFSKKYKQNAYAVYDLCALSVTICLFIGRIMNFVNGELYGRKTDGSWGVIFPMDQTMLPRHPSQLYESFAEGLCLFVLLFVIYKRYKKFYGLTGCMFIILYAIFRFIIEFFREPDTQIGYIFTYFTLGQLLCISMAIIGFIMLKRLTFIKQ